MSPSCSAIILFNDLIFNDLISLLIEKIIVYQISDAEHKIKLEVIHKTGESIYISSQSLYERVYP